ncbi:MAG: type II toxin-antitoxin system VapB family antitoxin [Myxococcota bacterium]
MRTNVVLNEELLQEAQRYSTAKSKSALLEEALRTLVQVRARERATENYASRLRQVQQKLQNKVFRESGTEILGRDRSRL